MHVLLTLASEPNEVFAREVLQHRVWPDVIVGDDVLVRAIGKIRRAFEDESVIETVPKVGYRLVAPVVRQSEPKTSETGGDGNEAGVESGVERSQLPREELPSNDGIASGGNHLSNPPYRRASARRLTLLLTAGAVALLAAIVIFLRLPREHPTGASTYVTRPFTTDPGSQIQGSFSPDGKTVAYVWLKEGEGYGQIYLMPVNSDQPRQLSPQQRASQFSPAWSPDGRRIAFIRKGEDHSGIMVTSPTPGQARNVYTLPVNSARQYGGITWSVDGQSLIFPQQNTMEGPSYLVELSLRDGAIRSITNPPALWDGDFSPAVSPDGRRLAFIRGSEQLARDVYVMSLPNGPAKRITRGALAMSLAWSADSSTIVFSSSRDGALSLWRVSAGGGEPQRLAEVGDDAYAPAIAKRGRQMIYSHGSALWGIFSVDLESHDPSPTAILTSSEEIAAPRVSPFGDRILFQSWRSGSREIWSARIDGGDPVQITNSQGESAGDPAWSPNGKSIAFDARKGPFAHIYVIGANGGKPTAVTSGNFNDVAPSWSEDGRYLFFGSNRSGSWQIWKAPVDGKHAPRQVTSNGGQVGVESLDGKYLYYTKYMTSGLWRQPVAGGRERKIFNGLPAEYPGFWALSKDGIAALSMKDQRYVLVHIDPATGRKQILDVLKNYSPTVGLSISTDGKELFYSGLITASSHLTLVENLPR